MLCSLHSSCSKSLLPILSIWAWWGSLGSVASGLLQRLGSCMLSSLGLGVINGKGFEITELGLFFLFTVKRSMISVMVKERISGFFYLSSKTRLCCIPICSHFICLSWGIMEEALYRAKLGEVDQWLKGVSILPENLGSVLRSYMSTHNCL